MKPGEHLVGNLLYFTRVSPSSLPALLTHMWKVLKAPLRKFVSRLSSQSLSSRIRPLSFCCFPGEQVLLLRVKDPTFLSSSLAFDWRFSALISEGYGFRPSSPHTFDSFLQALPILPKPTNVTMRLTGGFKLAPGWTPESRVVQNRDE